ncbi:YadA-like family protein [Mannheimia granulomatis]|uniref:YadA-like family protein n=1 Tax=Mannheimia granulomatis TaxID=85402 RepID=UPI00067DB010|nr:YadA-like family protein [Mannheimia granulomatis]QLB19786.1 hypothetical protein A6B41_10180 [Mannheimia granulomatis]
MNKIFKVIFNRTTQKMEVVSELARSQGKAAASTDERGEIKLAAGILNGATLIGGIAVFMLSATSAEAAVVIDSITGTNGNLVVTTNISVPTDSTTNPYNYFNPGSLSYDDRTKTQASGMQGEGGENSGLLYKSNTTSAIVIGHHATALEDRRGNRASGVAIGDYSHAGGALSVAIGPFSRTSDTGSVALGTSARAEGFNSFAAMRQSAAIADYSAAVGSSSWANEKASFAMGASATALGERSFAIGSGTPQTVDGNRGAENRRSIYDGQNNTLAAGTDAFSIGTKAKTNGESAFAIGTNAQAGGFVENTVGNITLLNGTNITIPELSKGRNGEIIAVVNADSTKKANNAYALGTNTRALSNDTVAFSTNATAQGDGAISFGKDSKANGTGAIAFGNVSNATGANAISIGWNATSKEEKVISIGAHSVAEKAGGIAIGETAKSLGNQSVTVGYNSNVSSANATAIGSYAKVEGEAGTSVGYEANAKGNYSTAMAYKSEASGNYSLAVGANTTVSGDNSGAFGQNNRVSGTDTFVLGSNVTVASNGSVILGNHSTAAEAKAIVSKEINGVTYNFAGHDAVVAGDYVSVGSDANERQIKFVAPGEVSDSSTDAINGSQLYAVVTQGSWTAKASGSNAESKVNFGDVVDFKSSDKSVTITPTFGEKDNALDFTVNVDGTTITRNADGKLSAVAAKVEKGTNIAEVKSEKDPATGITTYTINADGTTASHAESSKEYLTVTAGAKDPATNKTNYEVKLTDKALQDFKKDDDTKTGVIANPKNSEYLIVTEHTSGVEKREGDDRTYIVGLSEKAITDFTKDTHVTGGTVTYDNQGNANVILNKNDGTTAAVTGIKNNFVTSSTTAEDGKKATLTRNDGDTVDIDLSKTVDTAVTEATNKGFGLQAQDGNKVNKKLGEYVEVVGGNNNINTTATDGKVKVNLNNTLDLTDAGSVKIGDTTLNNNGLTITNGPSVTKDGINAGDNKITNVLNGTISVDSKEAVNGSQLYATNQNVTNLTNKVNQGFNIDADKRGDNLTAADNVQLGETVTYKSSDKNIVTTVTNNAIDFALNSTLTIGGKDGAPGIGLDGTNGTIGLTGPAGEDGKSATANITVKNGQPGVDGKDGETKTRIVYDGEEVATLNDGLKFVGDDNKVIAKKLNQTLNVTGGADLAKLSDTNIGVVNTNDGLVVKLAKDVNLTEAGSVTIGDTKVDNKGLTIKNGPSVTNTGIDAGNKQITNVSSGLTNAAGDKTDLANATRTNAVNVGDLKDVVDNLTNATTGGFGLTGDDKNTEVKQDLGKTIQVKGKDGVTVTANVAEKALEIALAGDVSVGAKDGKDGSIGVKGKDGENGVTISGDGTIVVGKDGQPGSVGINGKDGTIGINGKDGSNAKMAVEKGAPGLDGAKGLDGKDGEQTTRIIYTNEKGDKEEVANLNDGLRFTGNDNDTENKHKLNSLVTVKGEGVTKEQSKAFESAAGNINIKADGAGTLEIQLAKDLNNLNTATFTPKDGADKAPTTVVSNDGITITPKDGVKGADGQQKAPVKLTQDGLDNGNNQIVNVRSGIDGVNGADGQPVKSVNDLTPEDLAKVGTNAANINDVINTSKDLIAKGFKIDADKRDGLTEADTVELGQTVKYTSKDKNVITTLRDNEIDFGLSSTLSVGKDGEPGKPGEAGSIGVKGQDGKDGISIKGDTGANGQPGEATVVVGRDGQDGIDGKVGVNGKDGASVVLNGKDGSIGLTGAKGQDGKDGASTNITVKDGKQGVDGTGKDGLPGDNGETRIVYKNGEKEEQVANLNDGLIFTGNNADTLNRHKLNTVVNIVGEGVDKTASAAFKSAAGNINVKADGTDKLEIQLNKDLKNLNSATFAPKDGADGQPTEGPTTVVNNNGITITPKDGNNGADGKAVKLTEDGLDNGGNQVVNVDSGLKDKNGQPVDLKDAEGDVLNNAVNVGDLKNTAEKISTDAFGLKDKEGNEFKQNLGTTAQITGDNNINTKVIDVQNADGTTSKALEVSLNNDITVGGPRDGKDGSIGVKGADGKNGVTIKPDAIVFNGVDGKDGKDGEVTFKVEKAAPALDGKDGQNGADGQTRIVYEKPNGEKEQVATLNDGLKFVGDDGNEIAKKLNETLSVTGGEKDAAKLSDSNIGVVNSEDGLVVKLAKDLKDLSTATFTKEGEGEPKTVVNNNGIEITPTKDGKEPVKLTENGLDNGNNQIVNVKSGINGVNGQPGKDGKIVESVNDLTKEQLDKVGTNAANINDIRNATDSLVNTGFNITADNKDLNGAEKDNVKLGETVAYTSTDKNIVTTVRDNTIDFGLANNLTVGKDGKDGKPGEAGTIGVKGQDGKDGVSITGDNGKDGQPGEATITVGRDGKDGADGDNGIDGKVGVNGKDGSAVVLNGKDGSIGLNGKDGKDGLTFKSADGAQGVDGTNGADGLPGKDGKTRIVYQPTDKEGNPIKDDEGNPITEEVATLNDGLIFAGNNDKLNRHKLNSVVNIVGEVAQGINDKASSENFKSAAGNINVVANEKDQLEIQLNRELKDLTSAKFVEYKPGENGGKDVVDNTKPSTEITNNGITITPAEPVDGNGEPKDPVKLTQDGLDNGNNQIVNVKSGIDGLNGQNGKDGQPITSVNDLTDEQLENAGTNAANIKDVRNATDSLINKGFNITADNSELADGAKEDNVKLGETVNYTSKDKNIITTVSNNAIDFALNNDLTVGGPGKDGAPGKDGSIGVKGADGTAGVTLNGKDGSIGLTGPRGADGKDGASATISVKDGAKGLDGNDGKDGESKTRIVYEKPDGKTEEVATLNDGLRFVGDDGKVIDKKLNETLQISGGDTDLEDLSDDNIGVVNKDGKLMVKLAKNIDLTDEGSITIGDTYLDKNVIGVGDSALTGDSLTVGGDNSITVDGNKGTIGGLTNKTFDPNNFTSGQAATEDQLKQVYDVANSGWDIAANGQNTTNVGPKGKVSFNNEDGNIIITKETTDNNVTFALNNNLTIGGPGKDGSIGVKGADGTTGVTLNGKDGSIGINGKDGTNGTVTFAQGKPGVDGKDGETKSRIVYETKDKDGNPVKEEVATLNDGLKFVGDDGKVITKKLNETLSITGGEKDATKLSDANNIGVVNNNGTLTVKLAKDIDLTKDGSVTIGDTTVNNDGLTIKGGPSVTKAGINAGDKKITNVQDGEISETSKDAVNGSQLYQVQQVANAGWNLSANGKDLGNVKPGATVDLNNKDGNIVITKEGNNVTFGLNNDLTIGGKDGKDGQIGVAGKDGKDGVTIKGDGTITAGRDGADGVDGKIGVTGKDGASVVLNGKDGSIGLTGPKGADGKPGVSANIAVKDGAEGVDGTNGKDGLPGENGKTRIVYETKDKDGKPVTEQVATLNDGLIFSGNNEDTKNRQKLNTEVKVKGEGVDKAASENFKSATGNINVKANGSDTLEIQLAKNVDLTQDGSVTVGDTKVDNKGLTIKNGPSVTKDGIDAKGTKITNVKDGDVTATSKDAVNGSQLYNAVQNSGWELTVNGEAESQRINNNSKVNIKSGRNIEVSRKGSTVEIATSSNPEFDTVKVGGTTLSSTVAKDGVNELNVAGKDGSATRITNVAPGVKGTDAVNVNQLRSVANHVNNVDKDLRAGVAGALAAGNLYHVTQPGKSMVSAGVGTYRGQGALAVGYSRLSDNGKVGIKFSVNSNSRGHAGAAASVGYQW